MQTDLFLHKSYSMPAQANVLFEYVEQHFSDHAVHLVYEAGCCGFHAARYFLNWLREIEFENPMGTYSLRSKTQLYEFVKTSYLESANQLRAYCRKYNKEDYYLLKSIPGIGDFLASVIIAECGDIRRFTNENQFASFIGLVPGIHASEESEKSMGITPISRSQLRSYLIEAAWVAIRKDPSMQTYYRKHIGKNSKTIVFKVAYKMSRRILSVIKTKKMYAINHMQSL